MYDLPTTRHRVIDDSLHTISNLWRLDSKSNRRFGVFMTVVTLEVKSRVESPVDVVSRPAAAANVIAGRQQARFLNVRKTGFRLPKQRFGHAINCVPVLPFSDGKNAGNRTYPGWMAWISSAMRVHLHTHACRKKQSLRAFLAGFSGTVLLPVLPVSRPETPWGPLSGGADNGCYGKCEKHFPW